MPRKLKDIDVEEISLVRSAANRRKFIILKKEFSKMEWIEILKSFLGEEDEDFKLQDEDIEKAKQLPSGALKAITGALNILNKYKDVFPSDVLNAIKTLTKYAAYAYPEKKSAEPTDEEYIEDLVEKAGAKLSKATKVQLLKIKKIVDDLLDQTQKSTKDKYGDLPEEVQKALDEYERLKKAEEERIRKAKEEEEKKQKEEFENLKKEIEELKKSIEKKKRVRKGIEGQDDDGEDDDNTPKWPSLTGQTKED